MISSPSPRHPGGSRWPLLVILLFVVAGGVLAYRYLFTRPGEAAIQLIPADAAMVITLDTNPSPQQIPTFKRIADALKKEQADTQLDSFLTGMLQNSPVAKEIRPYIADSMAMALLPGSPPGGRGGAGALLLLAVTDVDKVGGVLARYGQQNTQDGLPYFQFPQARTCAALLGSYLALSDTPAPLAQAEKVRRGEVEAMAASAEYKQARAALPADANLMVFYSPGAMAEAIGTAGALKSSPMQQTHWVAMGLTVRDKGLEMAWRTASLCGERQARNPFRRDTAQRGRPLVAG
ncbi:MAG TPA: DUF3352 domain-containing protein [Chthonomonadaceae bacterium]|nr:DUF3352 domain-containing protein [Chthonomonadaceae bacterium]